MTDIIYIDVTPITAISGFYESVKLTFKGPVDNEIRLQLSKSLETRIFCDCPDKYRLDILTNTHIHDKNNCRIGILVEHIANSPIKFVNTFSTGRLCNSVLNFLGRQLLEEERKVVPYFNYHERTLLTAFLDRVTQELGPLQLVKNLYGNMFEGVDGFNLLHSTNIVIVPEKMTGEIDTVKHILLEDCAVSRDRLPMFCYFKGYGKNMVLIEHGGGAIHANYKK